MCHSLGVQRTWKERGKTTQGMVNKRAPKCPSINGKLKRKENMTSCSYRSMHSISRAAPYSKILFSPYLLWKDSLVCSGTWVMNACQLKGFSLLLPSVLHCCASAGQVCIWWTSRRGVGRGVFWRWIREREENTANQKEEWKTERTKRVGGQSICVAQSWSAVGKEGWDQRWGESKNLAEGAEGLDLDIFKSSFTSELKLWGRSFNWLPHLQTVSNCREQFFKILLGKRKILATLHQSPTSFRIALLGWPSRVRASLAYEVDFSPRVVPFILDIMGSLPKKKIGG